MSGTAVAYGRAATGRRAGRRATTWSTGFVEGRLTFPTLSFSVTDITGWPMRATGRSCARTTGKSSPSRRHHSGNYRAARTKRPPRDRRLFAWLPELDDMLLADDGHLAPSLFVVGRARVGGCEIVIRSDYAADLMQWFAARLAREHFVLHSVSADAPVLGHTARPQASSASRPACVIRALVHGGSHTTVTRTSRTPSSRSSRSRTSSMMKSDAGHPIAVKVRSTCTTPSRSSMP